MPISFRELTAGEATTEIVYNGHSVALTYDPSSVTENAIRDVGRMLREAKRLANAPTPTPDAAEDADDADAATEADAAIEQALAMMDEALAASELVNALLVRFLVRWDLQDDDERSMFPITRERLGDLPLPFRQACISALFSESRLGEPNGTTSKARSHATTSTSRRGGSRR